MKLLIKAVIQFFSPQLFNSIQRFNYERNILPTEFVEHMNRLTSNDLVIDVGANRGRVSECLALRGSKVISFEPNSNAFTKLLSISEKYQNIDAKNLAAGTKNRSVRLYLHKETARSGADLTQSSSLLSEKPNVSAGIFEEIQEIDFAEFLESLNSPVELIKIDIEGYEIELINHLIDRKVLDNVNRVYLETHERKFKALLASTEALKERVINEGYEEKFFFDWH